MHMEKQFELPSQPVMMSLNNIDEEKYPRRMRTRQFKRQFLEHTELVLAMQRKVSNLLSERLKAMTQKSRKHPAETQGLRRSDAIGLPSQTASTIQNATPRGRSRNLKWTRTTSLGSRNKPLIERISPQVCPRLLNYSNSSVSTQSSRRGRSPTHPIVQSFPIPSGRTSSPVEPLTSTLSSADN